MHRYTFPFIILSFFTTSLFAQIPHHHDHSHESRKIVFPDVPGYQTLISDLHMHTVFSDGGVWPGIRVEEAQRDGIDVVSMTEHLEHQPHKEDIPHPDRNRSYEIAKEIAEANSDMIVIKGSEVTRSMPPGHTNAIFIEDANKLLIDDPLAVFREANRQGAFVFWNHPAWTAHRRDGIARLSEMHKQFLSEGLLHGIEVVNTDIYSPEALQIALDYDLTIMGTSDIHGLIDWEYDVTHGGHRPVTLIFAEDRSQESIKQALQEGRTTVWYKDALIGREEYVVPLMQQSVVIDSASYKWEREDVLHVYLNNKTSSNFVLRSNSEYTFHNQSPLLNLEPHSTIHIRIKTLKRLDEITLPFEVLNAIIEPEMHPTIELEYKIDK